MRAVISTESDRVYEFGEFRLDPAAKMLFCRDEPVALTPKVFDTLQFMVEHAGRLLGKDELMESLWQDRFVEEGNLTFNIKVLRRALHDDAHHPRFIETVPRRGYRFIAEVKQRSLPLVANEGSQVAPISAPSAARKFYWAVPLVLVAGTLVWGTWRWQQRHAAAGSRMAPILAAPFKSQKLANSASGHALITPDGKYVAYTNESAGKQSIWLRQLETAENIQIVPPADVRYLGLAISHDGNSLYFVRRDSADVSSSSLYRVMTFGGIPVKINSQPQGWIAVSPDDQQISFVRCRHQPDESCSLFVIGSDGRNERRIVTRQRPAWITANKFSPDGKSVVFAAGQSFNGSRDFHLFRVDLANGAESEVSPAAFFVVNHLETLPGDEGYLFTAEETLDGKSRIWEVRRNGDTRALTNDSTDYNDISLSKSGARMVATHLSNDFQLHLAAVADGGNPKVLIAARTVAFTPDDRLVYSSDDGDLWTVNRDGNNQRQLTSNAFNDFAPRVSPDGRYIFFASNRAGSNQVWRMNADGSDPIQLTHGEGGYPAMVTPDGQYVYFLSGLHQTLWQVAVDGGKETQLWEQSVYAPAFSPDGKLVAYVRDAHKVSKIEVASLADHKSLHDFRLNDEAEVVKIVWANDAKSVIYIHANGLRKSLWEQPLDGAAPRLIADLGSDEIEDLALSPDGRTVSFIQGKWIHAVVLIEGLKMN